MSTMKIASNPCGSEIAYLASHCDRVLSRWASIMLTSDVYAGVIDQHVELGGDIAWIAGIFHAGPRKRSTTVFVVGVADVPSSQADQGASS
jgi:hypothetical protein